MKKIYSWIIFFLLLLLCHLKSDAQSFSSGSKNGSLFTNVTCSGVGSWNNPANVATSNTIPSSLSATILSGDDEISNYLYVQNFGFNIPANAVVTGITVKIEGKQIGADGSNTFVKDNSVYLLRNSSIIGNNHAFPWNWSGTFSNVVHGNPSDTWGAGLTAADINSPNFGVAINVNLKSTCCDQNLSANIDHVAITVFYTIPLPVEIENIYVSALNNRQVNIGWTTISENNNAGFSIERSTDAINWEEVKYVAGAGNSNSQIHYSVIDEHPYGGTSYYRIKQTDTNGNSKYYDPQVVEILNEIFITPKEEFLEIYGIEGDEVVITIMDHMGKVIKQESKFKIDQSTIVETEGVHSGIYIVIVETPRQKKTQKFYL